MECRTVSEGIQAVIDLLEAIPVRAKDVETTGFGLYTAIKNLYTIKEAAVNAEKEVPSEPSLEVEVASDDTEEATPE